MRYRKARHAMNLTTILIWIGLAYVAFEGFIAWQEGERLEAMEEQRKLDAVDDLSTQLEELQMQQQSLDAQQQGTFDVILDQQDALRSLSIEVTK